MYLLYRKIRQVYLVYYEIPNQYKQENNLPLLSFDPHSAKQLVFIRIDFQAEILLTLP